MLQSVKLMYELLDPLASMELTPTASIGYSRGILKLGILS
jgi:hypothetical protein